jgi:hypothetical protein
MGKGAFQNSSLAGIVVLLSSVGVQAQAETYTSNAGDIASLGSFVVDAAPSVFRLSASGNTITRQSGNGVLITSSSFAAPTSTVTCTRPSGNCNGTYTFTVGSPNFAALNVSGIAVTQGSGTITQPTTQNVNPVTFRVTTTNASWTVTFKVGFDMTVSTSSPGSGNKNFSYNVQAGH